MKVIDPIRKLAECNPNAEIDVLPWGQEERRQMILNVGHPVSLRSGRERDKPVEIVIDWKES